MSSMGDYLGKALEEIVKNCDVMGDVHACKNPDHLIARAALNGDSHAGGVE